MLWPCCFKKPEKIENARRKISEKHVKPAGLRLGDAFHFGNKYYVDFIKNNDSKQMVTLHGIILKTFLNLFSLNELQLTNMFKNHAMS